MSNQKRLRSNATALTTEQKQKLIEEAEITDDMDQKLAEEKMQKALDNKMKKELENHTELIKRASNKYIIDDYNKDLSSVPHYLGVKKEYKSKGEKVFLQDKIDNNVP